MDTTQGSTEAPFPVILHPVKVFLHFLCLVWASKAQPHFRDISDALCPLRRSLKFLFSGVKSPAPAWRVIAKLLWLVILI